MANENQDKDKDIVAGKTTPNSAPGATPASKKTVEVDAAVLEKLLNTVEKQGDQIKDLTQAADLGRLTRIQAARNQGKLVKTAKLSVYEGKIVLGWALIKDDVYTDEKGTIHEDQVIQLKLDEGKGNEPSDSKPMPYRTFARVITKVEGEVIKETKDKDGRLFFTIQLEDGREFELPIVFIN